MRPAMPQRRLLSCTVRQLPHNPLSPLPDGLRRCGCRCTVFFAAFPVDCRRFFSCTTPPLSILFHYLRLPGWQSVRTPFPLREAGRGVGSRARGQRAGGERGRKGMGEKRSGTGGKRRRRECIKQMPAAETATGEEGTAGTVRTAEHRRRTVKHCATHWAAQKHHTLFFFIQNITICPLSLQTANTVT